MTIYSSPPVSREFKYDKPTLLVCWWCTSFAAAIILFRVAGRYIRSEKLFKEDWLAFSTLIPLFIRMSFVHVVLYYGTNNNTTDGISDAILNQRVIGSKLVLASRIFYAATLWMLKLTISEFFKRLIPLHLWKSSYEKTFQFIRWFLLISFVAIVISDIAECQPIANYWQVVPDPGGQCRQGYAELITMGASNVITDLLLILFPIPIIIIGQMNIKRKMQLTILFSLSIGPIITTLIRIPNIIERQGSQPYRSLWASIEILVATAVANALVLGSFVRDRGVKKLKYKFGSTSDSIERGSTRRGTVQQRQWGSDEDLVRGLGLGMDRELRDVDNTRQPRVAPMALGGNGMPRMNNNWQFPEPPDADSDETDIVKFMHDSNQSPGEVSFINNTPRKVSFFDVGGLLDGAEYSSSRRTQSVEDGASLSASMSNESHSPTSTRKGSKALLQDLGGLLNSSGPSSRNVKPFKQVSMELQTMPTLRTLPSEPSLQDVGGLLK